MERQDLIHYFGKDLFVPKLKSKTKDGILAELAELFVKSRFVKSKKSVLDMLLKRETLGSTGIGKGVAIPHGRMTAAMDIRIAFGKSEKGVDFGAPDKKPVQLFFMVLAPTVEENSRYLPILGKLVEVVHDKKNRARLMKVQTYEEFLSVFEG